MTCVVKGDNIVLALWQLCDQRWSHKVSTLTFLIKGDVHTVSIPRKKNSLAKSRNNYCTALSRWQLYWSKIYFTILLSCFQANHTPFEKAVISRSVEVVEVLLTFGAEPNLQDWVSYLLLLHLRFAGIKHASFIKILHTQWSL